MELTLGTRMLIDASHAEELRVAILDQDRLEEFDFETTTKQQLKGNIYLAKIIRIEPSLQAAFVEFGGNRHGFLAFNEIHPDYYRIPIEDREALLKRNEQEETASEDLTEEASASSDVEILGGEDIEEIDVRPQRTRPSRHYKIQEVIARRQIMLVQVTKEERGGKGAALTTYLSLAGRYCVLMPNAVKGGGISRKITNVGDRKRLRDIIQSMQLPDTMSLIVRTAGMTRNKTEIKRDCDYLIKLWNEIREKTLHSVAPFLIYEESNLIKRAIRDYYTRDIEEIFIEGEAGYKEAKEFIHKLIPSHIKKIKQYKDEKMPLFYRYGVEPQIDAMYNPTVRLKSGGYIVFGTTEALVAIDVNSGKATRERHIEETAFKTNLEAAEEVARQLRLRDLAGLVVIDFIDMEDSRNSEAVERRLKDTMRHDRARVQVGRISPFGLLELSRQRLRPNIIESTSFSCPSCRGSGMIRSIESSSLHVLRAIEEEAIQQKTSAITVYVATPIALYVLNQKRSSLQEIEAKWNVIIRLEQDDTLVPPDYRLERGAVRHPAAAIPSKALATPEEPESQERPVIKNHQDRPVNKAHHVRPLPGHRTPVAHKIRSASEPRSETETEGESEGTQEAVPPFQNKTGKSKTRRRFRNRKGPHSPNDTQQVADNPTPAAAATISPPPPSSSTENRAPGKIEAAPPKKGSSNRAGWWKKLLE
jgi:ribonuclease E